MSLSERKKSHRRTASSYSEFSTLSSGHLRNENHSTIMSGANGILGPKISRNFIQGLSATWSGKPPKMPQPEQTQIVFQTVCGCLREIIKLAKNDLLGSEYAADRASVPFHHIKAAKRYLKKLEFHLSKLEELQDKYEVQRKMRDGIRSMAYAYILSHGKEKETALHSVHSGYKECNDLLCSYESMLEAMMGAFMLEMVGIQGFARMCSGDVFEIIIKHGDQKWKTRGHVLKDNKQTWENKRILFKSLFNEPLYIKAVEVRGLGKNIVLGNKYCETKDLFNEHPQQMTINLNPSGSLKLSLIITWNPVHDVSYKLCNMCARHAIFGSQSIISHDHDICEGNTFIDKTDGTTRKDLKHIFDSVDESHPKYTCDSITSLKTSASASSFGGSQPSTFLSDSLTLNHVTNFTNSCASELASLHSNSKSICHSQNADCQNSQIWSSEQSANSSECNSIEMASYSDYTCSVSNKLQETLAHFLSTLENILDQYPNLEELFEKVVEIEKLLKFQRQSALGSDVSISVKNALGCFDFLNSAVDGEDFDTASEKMNDKEDINDSEKKSIFGTEMNSHPTQSLTPSPQPLTSGIEQLDIALLTHVEYCIGLLEKLSLHSPLKCLEAQSVAKLKKQTFFFVCLLAVMRQKDKNLSCRDFFLENEDGIKSFWLELVKSDVVVSVVEQMLPEFEKAVQFIMSNTDQSIVSQVAYQILCEILDKTDFGSDAVITVYQLRLLFVNYNTPVKDFVKNMTLQTNIINNIKSKEETKVKLALYDLKSVMPFPKAFMEISLLLIDEDNDLKRIPERFLEDLIEEPTLKSMVTTAFLEGLESNEQKVRQGSCAALRLIEACECFQELAYISLADENFHVRQDAKLALFSFGDKAVKTYEDFSNTARP